MICEVSFAREKISSELIDGLVPLAVDNFRETGFFQNFKLEPDFTVYTLLEQADVLRVFTVREDDRLVGYSIFTVAQHTHFKSVLQAKEEVIYLTPESRKGTTGPRFIEWVDKALEDEGVNLIIRCVSELRDWSPVLLRKGYQLAEKTYAKHTGANHGH